MSAPVEESAHLEPHRAWEEYLRTARQLDAVRRDAAGAADGRIPALRAAREELASVRARLVPQRSRLLQLGVPESALHPSPPEVVVAARGVAGGPDGVFVAVRQVRLMADAVDAALAEPVQPSHWSWLPRLLVFGPLVILMLLVCAGLATVWVMR